MTRRRKPAPQREAGNSPAASIAFLLGLIIVVQWAVMWDCRHPSSPALSPALSRDLSTIARTVAAANMVWATDDARAYAEALRDARSHTGE